MGQVLELLQVPAVVGPRCPVTAVLLHTRRRAQASCVQTCITVLNAYSTRAQWIGLECR